MLGEAFWSVLCDDFILKIIAIGQFDSVVWRKVLWVSFHFYLAFPNFSRGHLRHFSWSSDSLPLRFHRRRSPRSSSDHNSTDADLGKSAVDRVGIDQR